MSVQRVFLQHMNFRCEREGLDGSTGGLVLLSNRYCLVLHERHVQ